MNDHSVLKIVAAYLLISGLLSVWYASGSIVSGGHLGIMLGSVCPISNPHSGINESSGTESEGCPRLVAKIKSIESVTAGVALFALVAGLISIIISIGVWVFQGGSKKEPSAKNKV